MRKTTREKAGIGAIKCIALFCAVCIIATMLSCAVFAESDVTVTVSDVTNDIITISGSAPVDTMISIKILKPGVSLSSTISNATDADDFQFLDVVFSKGGKFSRSIKMDTGVAPNKNEGAFTIVVSINGKRVYYNDNFLFYSNETKLNFVESLKSDSKAQLLETEGGVSKLEKIFETYSLSGHELYGESSIEDLAEVICAQESRINIAEPSDVDAFLLKALVLSAFDSSSSKLFANSEIKYADVWAKNGDAVDALYSDKFVNDLSDDGKSAVAAFMLSTDYSGAQFEDIFKTFEESIYYHLIKSNNAMGTGHIEKLLLTDYKTVYENAGFKLELIENITNNKEKTTKLNNLLESSAETLQTLATDFNTIMAAEYVEGGSTGGNSGGGGSSSGGPSSSAGAPAGGGGGGFTGGTEAPKPTESPVAAHPFKDMESAAWAREAVEYLYKEGIVNGRSETEFVPSATVTRAELVKMICQAMKIEETTTQITFSDVVGSEWFAPFANRALAAGIVKGDGGAFYGNREITREDAAVIIFRALGLENKGEVNFSDKDAVSDYAKEAIASMVSAGIINGMGDGTFAPKATLTRAQAAQLIYNAIKGGTN